MAKSTVAVKFIGDVSSLKRAMSDTNRRLGDTESKFSKFGKVAAAGFAAAGVAAVVFGASAIEAGSDLEETLSKSNTVFRDNAKEIEDWADTASTAFGQSKQDALEAASSFGNMFTQLGIGEDVAADMSVQMTELASDFASFHNADITEVLQAQQAAFRGEYDAVQRFVPTINAAAVEQKALEMGLAATTAELTAEDKALATQALMLEGAGDAAGDFARTSDGLANQQRILSARFEDVQARIGQALIPIMLRLSGVVLNDVIPALEGVLTYLSENKEAAYALAAAFAVVGIAGVLAATGPFAPWLALTAAIIAGGLAIQYVIDKYDLLPKAAKLVQPLIDKFGWLLDIVMGIDRFIGRITKSMGPLAAAAGALTSEADPADVQDVFDIINKNHAGSTSSGGPTRGRLAAGGRFSPGNWLVGENGPEVVTMGGSGYVTPNHQLGGDTYNISVTAQHEPLALAVVRELKRNKLLMAGA